MADRLFCVRLRVTSKVVDKSPYQPTPQHAFMSGDSTPVAAEEGPRTTEVLWFLWRFLFRGFHRAIGVVFLCKPGDLLCEIGLPQHFSILAMRMEVRRNFFGKTRHIASDSLAFREWTDDLSCRHVGRFWLGLFELLVVFRFVGAGHAPCHCNIFVRLEIPF